MTSCVDHVTEYRAAFDMFDRDGSGTITTEEMMSAMKSFGQNPTRRETEALIQEVDSNCANTLTHITHKCCAAHPTS